MKKNTFKQNIIGVLVIVSIIILPASADNVLDITVTEYASRLDTFNGTQPLFSGGINGTGLINITNTLSSTTLYDINLNLSSGTTDSATWNTISPGVTLTPTGSNVIVHINNLSGLASVLISYNMTSAPMPIIFSETYAANKILVNDSTNASLTLTYNSSVSVTNIQLIKAASDVNSNSISDFIFSNDAVTLGTSLITTNDTITWNIPELNATSTTATLNFTITESDSDAHNSSTPQSATLFNVGNATLSFTASNSTISGSGVTVNGNPTATTLNFQIELQKNQLGTSEGGSGGNDWGFTPTITNGDTETINFSISAVTVYVTNTTNLEAVVNTTTYPAFTLSNSGTWTQSEWQIFDFPDPVPVGWIDVDLSVNLSNMGGQLTESYYTSNGSYILIEQIYVISGYLIEVRKTITPNDTTDYYDISLWVHNKGNLATPPTVVVYDIVPQNFSMVYMSRAANGSTSITSPIIGQAYWWNVSTLQADGTPGNQTYVNYTVNGTGIYRMMDLFIVGIDPTYSLTMQSTPVLSISNIMVMDANLESLLGIMTIGMLVIGTVGRRRRYN
ncbi:MAG: hypothetical protein K0A89_00695 [ANME-2 cluster archaeon]|nr:hypothetical protein [ANME-2 cluster archaeon]